MNSDRKTHWGKVYMTKTPTEVSWHQAQPTVFLFYQIRQALLTSGSIIRKK